MPSAKLTVRNTSGGTLRLGFIGLGLIVQNGVEFEVDSEVVKIEAFRALENAGSLAIVDYGSDPTRYAIKEEIGTGSGSAVTRVVSPKEAVLRGNWFTYVLSPLPISSADTLMIVEGIIQTEGEDYTIEIATGRIHWLVTANFDISITDDVTFRYTQA
jgi:hypothetical protein